LFLIFNLFADLVKIQDTGLSLNFKQFDIKKIMTGLLRTTKDLLNFLPSVKIGKLPKVLLGDDVRLNLLLFFLLKNANSRNRKNLEIDNSAPKSVKVTVTTNEGEFADLDGTSDSIFTDYFGSKNFQRNTQVVFKITDYGDKLSSRQIKFLFE